LLGTAYTAIRSTGCPRPSTTLTWIVPAAAGAATPSSAKHAAWRARGERESTVVTIREPE
jgi:hypothetical protein